MATPHAVRAGAAASVWLMAPLALLLALAVARSGGVFYSLDDPYIHLTLARNLWHGNYGINFDEPSAPSSSIVWPLLLAPFSALPGFEYLPLFINAICLFFTARVLLGHFGALFGRWRGFALTLALLFAFNFYGVALTGMEHSLQLLLVALIATRLMQRRLDTIFFTALALLPWVRYEGAAIALPLLVWAFIDGRRRPALIAAGVMLAGLVAFSLFLHDEGLGWLPSSVLAKTGGSLGGGGDAASPLAAIGANLMRNLVEWHMALALLLALTAAALVWRDGERAFALLALVAPALLHMLFGRNGWFGRYELYFLLYVAVVFIGVMHGRRWLRGWRAAVLALVAALSCKPLIGATLNTPLATKNIRDQQQQMAVIVSRYLDEPVAVNDLGLVSFRSRQPVLDLWGLGSAEALRLRLNDPRGAWIAPLMAREDVHLALIYDELFPQRPASWIAVARLMLNDKCITPLSPRVALYATDEAAAERLRIALLRYQAGEGRRGASIEFAAPEPALAAQR